MNRVKYQLLCAVSKLFRLGNTFIVQQFRKEGIKIGQGTRIFSNIITSEPYLISIGKNCTISTEVNFITHDASIGLYMGREVASDIVGTITIGDNCFIGNRAILLYGVKIPDNTIVAAGSIIGKSIAEPGCIVVGGGKIAGKVEDFLQKHRNDMLALHGLKMNERKNTILDSGKIVQR